MSNPNYRWISAFALLWMGCTTPPIPKYQVDRTSARNWEQSSNPVSCLLRDSVVVDLRIQSIREVVLWTRDEKGLRLFDLEDDSLYSIVIPDNWTFQEILTHDDCQPGRGDTLRFALFIQGILSDSLDFPMNDSLAGEWMEAFGRGDRKPQWELIGINGDSAKFHAEDVVKQLAQETQQHPMSNEERILWLKKHLWLSDSLYTLNLLRPWKGLTASIDRATTK